MSERLGWKAGFGTKAAMEALGTTGPLSAPLTNATLLADGATQSIEGWTTPMLEAEVAVRLGPDGGIEALAPAIELADVDGPTDDVVAILATNIFHRAVILGRFGTSRPEGLTVDVVRNGEAEVRGADAFALTGTPEDVLAMMATTGAELRPGDVVITGAVVAPMLVRAGDDVVVSFDALGSVRVRLA